MPEEPAGGAEPIFTGQSPPGGFADYPHPPAYAPAPPWTDYRPAVPVAAPQQTFGWVIMAAVGLLGLLGAILTLTLWINANSAVNRAADICERLGRGYAAACRQQVAQMVPGLPPALVGCLFLIVAAGLAVAAGSAMLFARKPLGQFVVLGGGVVMLMLSIGVEARFGATGRLTYDLIAGLSIVVAGALMFVPAFRIALGLPPQLGAPPAPHPGGTPWSAPTTARPPGPPSQW